MSKPPQPSACMNFWNTNICAFSRRPLAAASLRSTASLRQREMSVCVVVVRSSPGALSSSGSLLSTLTGRGGYGRLMTTMVRISRRSSTICDNNMKKTWHPNDTTMLF